MSYSFNWKTWECITSPAPSSWTVLCFAAHAQNIFLRKKQGRGRQGNGPTLFGPTFQPTDQPTESDRKRPRHPTEKYCNGTIRSLASVPGATLFGRMLWSSSIGFRWSVGRLKVRSDECVGALICLRCYMYIYFEIHFVAIIHYLKMCIGPKTILTTRWKVGLLEGWPEECRSDYLPPRDGMNKLLITWLLVGSSSTESSRLRTFLEGCPDRFRSDSVGRSVGWKVGPLACLRTNAFLCRWSYSYWRSVSFSRDSCRNHIIRIQLPRRRTAIETVKQNDYTIFY